MNIYQHIEDLIDYAVNNLQLDSRDTIYTRNTIFALLNLSGGEAQPSQHEQYKTPDTLIAQLMNACLSEGILQEEQLGQYADLILGVLSLNPSQIDREFQHIYNTKGAESATAWLYDYCVKNGYVKKEVLDRNPRFDADNGLVVTINKAKPEFRDPKKAVSGNSVKGGYPKCVICWQNEGYFDRSKRTLRTVDVELEGGHYFWQYSPYGYFNQHGILVNKEHIPMHVDKYTYINLLQFVDKFPHYFIGCNAPLPRIGGSVLAHDHYQGGLEELPLFKAKDKRVYHTPHKDTKVSLLDWPGTVIRIQSKCKQTIVDMCLKVQQAWENYNNEKLGIVAKDNDGQHSTVSPTVLKRGDVYSMNIILRNNITSQEYPDGVFHAHPEYHSIKKESIGLIEAQGLFILPGRLESQLQEVEQLILSHQPLSESLQEFKLVYDGLTERCKGNCSADAVHNAVKAILADICYHILENTAVFKDIELAEQFLLSTGICTKSK